MEVVFPVKRDRPRKFSIAVHKFPQKHLQRELAEFGLADQPPAAYGMSDECAVARSSRALWRWPTMACRKARRLAARRDLKTSSMSTRAALTSIHEAGANSKFTRSNKHAPRGQWLRLGRLMTDEGMRNLIGALRPLELTARKVLDGLMTGCFPHFWAAAGANSHRCAWPTWTSRQTPQGTPPCHRACLVNLFSVHRTRLH